MYNCIIRNNIPHESTRLRQETWLTLVQSIRPYSISQGNKMPITGHSGWGPGKTIVVLHSQIEFFYDTVSETIQYLKTPYERKKQPGYIRVWLWVPYCCSHPQSNQYTNTHTHMTERKTDTHTSLSVFTWPHLPHLMHLTWRNYKSKITSNTYTSLCTTVVLTGTPNGWSSPSIVPSGRLITIHFIL